VLHPLELSRVLGRWRMDEQRHALALLNRLALRIPSQAGRLDQALLGRLRVLAEAAVDVAIETGPPISQAAARLLADGGDVDLAERIVRRCQDDLLGDAPPLRDLLLVARRIAFEARTAGWPNPNDTQKAGLALMAGNLAISLSRQGDTSGAAKLQRQVLAILRDLEDRHPRGVRPALAKCLFNLAVILSAPNSREEAIAMLRESLGIAEDLVNSDDPSTGALTLFASVLSSLGSTLSEAGQHEEALEVSQRAVAAFRRLPVVTVPMRSQAALGLERLGYHLAAAGLPRDALAATEEANQILRNLADEFPLIFLADLARNSLALTDRLAAAGRSEDAARFSEEAVRILKLDPASPDLAAGLTSLGRHLADIGEHAQALAVTVDAVEIARGLATGDVPGSRLNLASALNALGNRLGALDRGQEALGAFREAVAHWRSLAAENSHDVRPGMAMTLRNMGMQLRDVGEFDEAVRVTAEAIRLYRDLALVLPGRFLPHLALNLNHQGIMLSDCGRIADAVPTSLEAVGIYRQLAALETEDFRADLAMGLHNLGVLLNVAQRPNDALATTREATELFRQLVLDRSVISASRGAVVAQMLSADGSPPADAFQQHRLTGRHMALQLHLSDSLFNLGRRWVEHRQWAEAISSFEESIHYLQPIFEAHPAAFMQQMQALQWSLQDARLRAEPAAPESSDASSRSFSDA
jgi:tetratricopeptide (TPR) repeat protein